MGCAPYQGAGKSGIWGCTLPSGCAQIWGTHSLGVLKYREHALFGNGELFRGRACLGMLGDSGFSGIRIGIMHRHLEVHSYFGVRTDLGCAEISGTRSFCAACAAHLRSEKGCTHLSCTSPPCVRGAQCGERKKFGTLLDLCVSSLRRGHANLLCIVPIFADDPRRVSVSSSDPPVLRDAFMLQCGQVCRFMSNRGELSMNVNANWQIGWRILRVRTWLSGAVKFVCLF